MVHGFIRQRIGTDMGASVSATNSGANTILKRGEDAFVSTKDAESAGLLDAIQSVLQEIKFYLKGLSE